MRSVGVCPEFNIMKQLLEPGVRLEVQCAAQPLPEVTSWGRKSQALVSVPLY